MNRPHHIPAFGTAVKAVLHERGLSLRGQRLHTGIDHMTMKEMADGLPPRLEKVEQFARAFELDVNEWRALAGYDRVDAGPPGGGDELSPRDHFWARFGDLVDRCEALGIDPPQPPRFAGGSHSLESVEQADRVLESVIEGLKRDWPEHADRLS